MRPTQKEYCRGKIAAMPSEPSDPARYEPTHAAFSSACLDAPTAAVSKALVDLCAAHGFLAEIERPPSYICRGGRPPTFYRVTDAGREWLLGTP